MGRPREFRIYKPKQSGDGSATAWQLSFKEQNKYNPWMLFLVAAKQTGMDEKGNAKFDWDNSLTVKLGDADIGELISVLEGRKDKVGSNGSLFHQTPGGGNKVVKFESSDYGFNVAVSAQDEQKNKLGPIYHSITHGEAALLLTLLRRAVEIIYEW